MPYTRAEIQQVEDRLAEVERRVSKRRMEIEGLRAAGMRTAASESILASMEDLAETLRASVRLMHRSSDRT
jgi:hypothetical protein